MIKLNDYKRKILKTTENYIFFNNIEDREIIIKKWKYDCGKIYLSEYSLIIYLKYFINTLSSFGLDIHIKNNFLFIFHRISLFFIDGIKYQYNLSYIDKLPNDFNENMTIIARYTMFTYSGDSFINENSIFIKNINSFKIFNMCNNEIIIKKYENMKIQDSYIFRIFNNNHEKIKKHISNFGFIKDYNYYLLVYSKLFILDLEKYLNNDRRENDIFIENLEYFELNPLLEDKLIFFESIINENKLRFLCENEFDCD